MYDGTFPAHDMEPSAPMIVIHQAREEDLPAMNRLMQASHAYDGVYRRILDGYSLTPEKIARDHPVLADRHGDVLGFYSLITGGEPELDLMFVANDAQGIGLGTCLFRHMRAEAERLGLTSIRIVSHPPSLSFYKRMGAIRIGTKPPTGRVT